MQQPANPRRPLNLVRVIPQSHPKPSLYARSYSAPSMINSQSTVAPSGPVQGKITRK